MKTTKAMFNRFKKEFLRLVPILNINGYHYYFYHRETEYIAEVIVDEPGKAVTVVYGINRTDRDSTTPESDAKHEAIHVLLHRLAWLGDKRYTGSSELEHESEHLVVVLEKII